MIRMILFVIMSPAHHTWLLVVRGCETLHLVVLLHETDLPHDVDLYSCTKVLPLNNWPQLVIYSIATSLRYQASQHSQFYCESHSFRLNLKVSQARQKISQ